MRKHRSSRRSSAEAVGDETQKRKKHRGENLTVLLPSSVQVMENFLEKGPNPSLQGDETQKRKKHRGENLTVLLPSSVQVMENFLEKGPNPSLQVVDENSNLQTGNTADIKKQRHLSHFSEIESEGLNLMTYSTRSSKVGHMRKKKNQNTSQENLQKIISHNKKSCIVKPAETGFSRKKHDDASFGESSLGVGGKEDGPMREGRQADRASTVSTDSDPNTANFFDSKTNKCTRRRRRRKRRNKTSSNVRQVSVSEQVAIVLKESENVDSVKNGDLYPDFLSKSYIKMENNINQGMSVKQDSSGVQINSSVIAVNNSDLHYSRRHSLKMHLLKTYSRRCKNAGQRRKFPHRSSNLNSRDNKNDLCSGSSSIMDASEADCERLENDSASFCESPVNAEKDGGPSMNMQTCPTNFTHSDINSNFHEVDRMDLGGIKKARGRRKKNKTRVCKNPLSVSEDMSVSVKSDTIEVEKTDMDSVICSKSKVGNTKSNSGGTHTRKKNRARKELEMAAASKNGSLDNAQLCIFFPKILKPKNEDFCEWKGENLIGETSNGKDGERCPHSSVQGVTDDIMSDAIMKENITFDNMDVPLQRPLINDGMKKLLILDLNGLLVDVFYERHPIRRPPIRVSGKSVYKRPFCEHFLEFCFERFNIGVWSSRQRKNIDVVVNFLFGEKKSRLLFVWDLSKCTPTGFNTLENMHKPLVLKELKKLWNKEDVDLPWEKGDYSPSNTLLIDDSPYKALCNPPHTAIFPIPYDYRHEEDYALGLGGDLRIYLERLAMADNVQNYVKEHPFGQRAIMPGNASWRFYLQIIEKMEASFTSASSF